MKTLILGGARSGKSTRAENLAKQSELSVVYVATSPYFEDDHDWNMRIQMHKQQRPCDWQLVEEEQDLVGLLRQGKYQESLLLIDCLTLWLSNMMYVEKDIAVEIQKLCDALSVYTGAVILVSNEVGLGLVPESTLGRDFRDAQGRLNQQVAAVSEAVEFVVAGLPMRFK